MTYVVLPNSGQSLGITRVPINTNFSLIQSVFDLNHYTFNNTGAGKHRFVEMPVQSLPIGLIAGEGTLYTKTSGESSVFYSPDATGNEYQLTRTITASFAKFSTNTALTLPTSGSGGWTFLPGGMLMQYGSFDPTVSTTVIFPISFTSAPFSVQLTGAADNNSTFRVGISTGSITATQFVFQGTIDSHSKPIYFVAIGK